MSLNSICRQHLKIEWQKARERRVVRSLIGISFICLLLSSNVLAQFTGPTIATEVSTVEEVSFLAANTYVTVVGNIVAHIREDYYLFRDETGEIRVEIENSVWQNRAISPDTAIRLVAEVDQNSLGLRYLWIASLEILE